MYVIIQTRKKFPVNDNERVDFYEENEKTVCRRGGGCFAVVCR